MNTESLDDDAQQDFQQLDATRAFLGQHFAAVIAAFSSDTPVRLQALHAALLAHDSQQTARLAHALAGSCASIGATHMARLCRELQQQASQGGPDPGGPDLGGCDPDAWWPRLEREYARIESYLQACGARPPVKTD